MKILLSFLLIFVFVFESFGSPLVFKATKEIKSASFENFVDLASFNTKNHKQIRIALQKQNLENGKSEYVRGFRVYAVESSEEILLNYYEGYSAVIDVPSDEIKVKVGEAGNYKIYVWATQ